MANGNIQAKNPLVYHDWSNKLTVKQSMLTLIMFSATNTQCCLATYNSHTNTIINISGSATFTATKNNDGTVTITANNTGDFAILVIL